MVRIFKIKIFFIFVLFSLGKLISATGQTLFGLQHSISHIFKNSHIVYPYYIILSSIAACCTLLVIMVTRVSAMYRQFYTRPILFYTAEEKCYSLLSIYDPYFINRVIISMLIFSSFAAGIFASIGAYLGSITFIEFITNVCDFGGLSTKWQKIFIQSFVLIVAASTFASYYSFNFQKTKQNINKFFSDKSYPIILYNAAFLKTLIVSIFSLISIPVLSYFLTKNALYHIPYIIHFLSSSYIKCISLFSSIVAIITSTTTTIPAAYDYFSKNEIKKCKNDKIITFLPPIRHSTYAAGFVDSAANGLTNFVGVIDVVHDAFNVDPYGHITVLAVGCGISSALMNAFFSVRQGVNDFENSFQHNIIDNDRNHIKFQSYNKYF